MSYAMPREAGPERIKIGRMPIPHEHGAWVILYAPVIVVLAAVGSLATAQAGLIVAAVTGLYLARNAASLLLRKRRDGEGAGFWLAIYLVVAVGGAAPLLLVYRRTELLWIGVAAALLFVLHATLGAWPSRRRLDRSLWGELLAVAALCLTAPAAEIAARGTAGRTGWLAWAACAVYFGGGIFFVKMLLDAAKHKGELETADRLRIGRANLTFHGLAVVAAAALAGVLGGVAGVTLAAGFVPGIFRAARGTARLQRKPPSLKKVGYGETLYALWFIGSLLAALLIAR